MSLDYATLNALAIDFAAMPPGEEELPRQVELVIPTGETLSHESIELARLYDRSTLKQRAAFDALAESSKAE